MESTALPSATARSSAYETRPHALSIHSLQSLHSHHTSFSTPGSAAATEQLLRDNEPPKAADASGSAFYTVFKSLRLRLVFDGIAKIFGKRFPEEEKTAMRKSRVHAVLQCTIHILPVAAAIALVALNLSEYYIGGELAGQSGQDGEKLAALQFTAKLHELLMLASIATVLLTYIRRELVFGDGIPYGAVFAGLQYRSIDLLWSFEFWGAVQANWQKRHKKVGLLALVVVCTMLGVSVGPSTATLMRPRLADWPAGGTTFWINATNATLAATHVDASPSIAHCDIDLGDPSCPSGGWEILSQDYFSFWPQLAPTGVMPESLLMNSRGALRTMEVRHRSTDDGNSSIYWNAFSIATTQTSAMADSVLELARLWLIAAANIGGSYRYRFRKDADFVVTAPQALTQARCVQVDINPAKTSQLRFEFPVLSAIQYQPDAQITSGELDEYYLFKSNNASTVDQVESLLHSGMPPSLVYIDDAGLLQNTASTLLAIATFPETASGQAAVFCCGIQSRWTPSPVRGSRDAIKIVTGSNGEWYHIGTNDFSWPQITTTAAWAAYLNPQIRGENATIFSSMASAAGMWNATKSAAGYNYPFIVESILATTVTNGLSRMAYNSSIVGSLKSPESDGWFRDIIPPGRAQDWMGSVYNTDVAEQANATMFTMYATVNGYAYSATGRVQQAAMAVLLFYTLFALGHFGYSLASGWSSQSWDSMPEMAALAMNSRRTQGLKNTGAGISTIGVYKEKVWIRVRDDHLEFIFKDTLGRPDCDFADRLRKNKKYG